MPELETPTTECVWTLTEAALFLRVSDKALADKATAGEVPARQIGGEWRFLRRALVDWLYASAGESANGAPARPLTGDRGHSGYWSRTSCSRCDDQNLSGNRLNPNKSLEQAAGEPGSSDYTVFQRGRRCSGFSFGQLLSEAFDAHESCLVRTAGRCLQRPGRGRNDNPRTRPGGGAHSRGRFRGQSGRCEEASRHLRSGNAFPACRSS